MCLAVPVRILSIEGSTAEVEIGGVTRNRAVDKAGVRVAVVNADATANASGRLVSHYEAVHERRTAMPNVYSATVGGEVVTDDAVRNRGPAVG